MESNIIAIEEVKPFDYSKLDITLSGYLQEKVYKMKGLYGEFYTELGMELKEVQEELSTHGYGCFEEWFTSLKLKKDYVYRLINRYDLIVANCEEQKLIEQMQLSLSYEIAKPNAPKELVDQVFKGEIKTHKEYQQAIKESKKKVKPFDMNNMNNMNNSSPLEATAKTIIDPIEEVEPIDNIDIDNQVEVVLNHIDTNIEQVEEQVKSITVDEVIPAIIPPIDTLQAKSCDILSWLDIMESMINDDLFESLEQQDAFISISEQIKSRGIKVLNLAKGAKLKGHVKGKAGRPFKNKVDDSIVSNEIDTLDVEAEPL